MTTNGPLDLEATQQQQQHRSRFHVLAELGRGGMATVYLAVAKGPGGFNKLHVIKRLRPALSDDPEFLQMFLDEARLSARINHPNVVQTYEVGFDGSHHFIAMEYLEGPALQSILKQKQPPRSILLYIVTQTLAGLHHAHELTDFDGTPLNVVHRDVSPHNIVVTYDGHVKVLDFGIAKAADSTHQTRTGVIKGKCRYMALEQFNGKNIDRRADVFAVGVMLWQALTGRRLWHGLEDSDILHHLVQGNVPRPRDVEPSIPAALEDICMRALAVKASDRWATAADFQNALEVWAMRAGDPVATPREVSAFVTEAFAERRQQMRTAIDAALRKPATELSDGRNTLIRVGAAGGTASGMSSNSYSSSHHVEVYAGEPSDQAGVSDAMEPRLPSLHTGSGVSRSAASSPRTGSQVVDVGAGERRRNAVLLGLVAASTAAGIVLAQSRWGPTSSAAVQPAHLAAAAPTSATCRMTFSASPPEARLYFDDVPLDGNPAIGSFACDGISHRLRAEARGHITRQDWVVLDRSTTTASLRLEPRPPESGPEPRAEAARTAPTTGRHLAMARAAAAPPPSTTQPAIAAPTPPPATTAARSSAAPDAGIDRIDPWK